LIRGSHPPFKADAIGQESPKSPELEPDNNNLEIITTSKNTENLGTKL